MTGIPLKLAAVVALLFCIQTTVPAQSLPGNHHGRGFAQLPVQSAREESGILSVDSIDYKRLIFQFGHDYLEYARMSQATSGKTSGEDLVTVSIFLRDVGNGVQPGLVLCWERSSGVTIASAMTAPNGSVQFLITPGDYGLYIRGFHSFPYTIENFRVERDTSFVAFTDGFSWPEQTFVVDMRWNPLAIYAGGSDAARLELETIGANIDSIFFVDELGVLQPDGGEPLFKVRLYDDGTHGDRIQGDGIFSRGGIAYNGPTPSRGGRLGHIATDYIVGYRQGQSQVYKAPTALLCLVTPAIQRSVLTSGSGYQVSDHIFNVQGSVETEGLYGESQRALRLLYSFFPDEFDFAYVFADNPLIVPWASHVQVRNEVSGIGLDPVDGSKQWGESSVLKGVNFFPPLPEVSLLHQTGHGWGAYLNRLFQCSTYGWHWGYSGVYGVLGGLDQNQTVMRGPRDYWNPTAMPGGCTTDDRGYAWLELYTMGLARLEEVPSYRVYDVVGTFAGEPQRFDAIGGHTVTPQTIVDAYGPRIPSWENSQKSFKSAFLVVSRDLLSPAGMAFFSVLAEVFSGELDTLNNISFAKATLYRGTMDTRLLGYGPLPPGTPLLVAPAPATNDLVPDGVAFRWTRVRRADSYTIQASTDSLFSRQSIAMEVTRTDTFIRGWNFAYGMRYFWRVKANNPAGSGPYSTVSGFSTKAGMVEAPIPIYPPPSGAVVPVNVTLRWHRATGATMYHVQVSGGPFSTVAVDDTVVQDSVLRCTLEPASHYLWRIRSLSPTSQSSFRPCGEFSTPTWAAGPRLVSPADQSLWRHEEVEFKWRTVDPMTGTFHVQVAEDPYFVPSASNFWVNDTLFGGLDDTSLVRTLPAEGTYYWRVSPLSSGAEGPFSTTWSFSIYPLPEPVTLVSPPNGGTVFQDTVLLVWHKSSPGVTGYVAECGFDSAFTQRRTAVVTDTFATFPDLGREKVIWWRVSAYNRYGVSPTWSTWRFNLFFTDVASEEPLPTEFRLEQNFPNPFNPRTEVRSQMSEARHVKLAVYDLLGREVAVLVNERRSAGRYQDTFDGSRLASGVYVCRMSAGSYIDSRRMVLLR